MSLLKAIKAQLGLSNTPANNFTLDASADNGTMKLARGNAEATTQDILTVDASGNVTAPQVFNATGGLQSGGVATGRMVLSTAQNSTSGTSIDFTSIPSWVKRVTVMFNEVSQSGTSPLLLQLGTSGGVQSTGYTTAWSYSGSGSAGGTNASGFQIFNDLASDTRSGQIHFSLMNSANGTWVAHGGVSMSRGYTHFTSGAKVLSGTLDRIRLTTVNGTDTFDAGSINIMYEG